MSTRSAWNHLLDPGSCPSEFPGPRRISEACPQGLRDTRPPRSRGLALRTPRGPGLLQFLRALAQVLAGSAEKPQVCSPRVRVDLLGARPCQAAAHFALQRSRLGTSCQPLPFPSLLPRADSREVARVCLWPPGSHRISDPCPGPRKDLTPAGALCAEAGDDTGHGSRATRGASGPGPSPSSVAAFTGPRAWSRGRRSPGAVTGRQAEARGWPEGHTGHTVTGKPLTATQLIFRSCVFSPRYRQRLAASPHTLVCVVGHRIDFF